MSKLLLMSLGIAQERMAPLDEGIAYSDAEPGARVLGGRPRRESALAAAQRLAVKNPASSRVRITEYLGCWPTAILMIVYCTPFVTFIL
jgi:hypothetical protein